MLATVYLLTRSKGRSTHIHPHFLFRWVHQKSGLIYRLDLSSHDCQDEKMRSPSEEYMYQYISVMFMSTKHTSTKQLDHPTMLLPSLQYIFKKEPKSRSYLLTSTASWPYPSSWYREPRSSTSSARTLEYTLRCSLNKSLELTVPVLCSVGCDVKHSYSLFISTSQSRAAASSWTTASSRTCTVQGWFLE